jgi:hypothetical protein
MPGPDSTDSSLFGLVGRFEELLAQVGTGRSSGQHEEVAATEQHVLPSTPHPAAALRWQAPFKGLLKQTKINPSLGWQAAS